VTSTARPLLLLASGALLFGAWPLVAGLGAISGALASIALAVLLALAASGGPCALSAAAGALGAFAAGLGGAGAPLFAGAFLLGGAYAERTFRVRTLAARAAHLAVAVLAGAIAAEGVASFSDAALPVRAVAVVVAAVLAALPALIEADDLVAHALEGVGREVTGPSRGALLAGAELRRNAEDALLDRATSRMVRPTWRALVRLGEARLRVQRARTVRSSPAASPGNETGRSPSDAVLAMLDGRIASHVAALARAYAAVDTARAAELGMDDVALRTTESAGEALEHVSRAMVDVET